MPGSSARSVQGSNQDTAHALGEGRRAGTEEDVSQQKPNLLQLPVLQRKQCLADLTPEHGLTLIKEIDFAFYSIAFKFKIKSRYFTCGKL